MTKRPLIAKYPKKGFTLIELLVVIGVIAILATIGAVTFGGTRAKARNARRFTDIVNYVKVLRTIKASSIDNKFPINGAEGAWRCLGDYDTPGYLAADRCWNGGYVESQSLMNVLSPYFSGRLPTGDPPGVAVECGATDYEGFLYHAGYTSTGGAYKPDYTRAEILFMLEGKDQACPPDTPQINNTGNCTYCRAYGGDGYSGNSALQ